jgi:uncharacterized protein (UPF0276 family)
MERNSIGIGFRQPHYRELLESRPDLDFLEVHSENFFVAGGPARALLERARQLYPVSLHGVGLSLGSADELALDHLAKLKHLVEWVEPALVSEHLSWGRVDGVHFNDLLPLPYTREALDVMSARIARVQDELKRQILIENLSAYVQFRASEMSETAFLAELARRTGCGILLDVNNLYVNAVNFGVEPLPLLAELPRAAVGEIHLAGHLQTEDCLIDDHGSRVCAAVWELYREALATLGPLPTLIEWDTDVPALEVLLDEAGLARGAMARTQHVLVATVEALHA